MSRDVVSEHPSIGEADNEQLQAYLAGTSEHFHNEKNEQHLESGLLNERNKVKQLEEKISKLVSQLVIIVGYAC